MGEIKDFLQFIIRPRFIHKRAAFSMAHKLTAIFVLVTLVLLMDLMLVLPNSLVDASFDDNQFLDQLLNKGILPTILLMVILAPLIEELIFRFYLPSRLWSLFSYLLIILVILIKLTLVFKGKSFTSYLIYIELIVFLGICVYIFSHFEDSFTFKKIFLKAFPYHIWFSAILFGAIHVFNYSFTSQTNKLLVPLLVLPQLFGGMALAYVRLKYGLLWSFVLHGIHNLVLTIAIYFGVGNH
jgi:uncharacterized protein